MSIEKYWNGRTKMHIPTCDICGKQLAEEWTFQEAVEAKKNAGWCSRKIDNEWIDICDDCKWDQSNFVSIYGRNMNGEKDALKAQIQREIDMYCIETSGLKRPHGDEEMDKV